MTNDVIRKVIMKEKKEDEKVRLTIKIPKQINDELEKMCKKIGITKNALITKILWESVGKE